MIQNLVVHGINQDGAITTTFYPFNPRHDLVRYWRDFARVFWVLVMPWHEPPCTALHY